MLYLLLSQQITVMYLHVSIKPVVLQFTLIYMFLSPACEQHLFIVAAVKPHHYWNKYIHHVKVLILWFIEVDITIIIIFRFSSKTFRFHRNIFATQLYKTFLPNIMLYRVLSKLKDKKKYFLILHKFEVDTDVFRYFPLYKYYLPQFWRTHTLNKWWYNKINCTLPS